LGTGGDEMKSNLPKVIIDLEANTVRFSWWMYIRFFGCPSLYECITGNLYDNKFKSLKTKKKEGGL